MGFLRDDAFWSATPTLLSTVISVTPVLLPSRPLPCKQYPLWLPRSPLLQHAAICHLSSTIHHSSNTRFGYHALRSCNMLSSAIYHLSSTIHRPRRTFSPGLFLFVPLIPIKSATRIHSNCAAKQARK